MRGKKVKQLRMVAKLKAQSQNATTYQGTHQVKLPFGAFLGTPETTNIVKHGDDYIFVQRLLHTFSLKAITKKLKKFLRVVERPKRHLVVPQLALILSKEPHLLGLGAST
jgi:hypothetical protein